MDTRTTKNIQQLNKKKVLIFVFAIIFFIFILTRFSKSLKITLNGNETINIEFGSIYAEPGAKALYGKKDISNTIEITNGNINTSKVGSYTVTYTAKHKKKTTSITRTVNVTDSENPALTLNGKQEINIAQNSKYQELGCSALDNYDGDITTKISIDNPVDTSKKGTYTVTYSVKDSSGNATQLTRTVNVVDKNSKNISTDKSAGLPVLMYHFFYDINNPPNSLDGNYMEIHDFEEQLQYLTENNYYFPTWEEVTNYVKGTSCLPNHSVVITVDDGNETFFDLAVPVINKYNVKVTSFIVTSWIKDTDYLKQFDTNKIIFESHSNDMHKAGSDGKGAFLTMPEDDAYSDVTKSQSFIGNATIFCYPFGHYNDKCEKILKRANYNLAFTTTYGRVRPGDNVYELCRIRMTKGDTLNTFIKRVS